MKTFLMILSVWLLAAPLPAQQRNVPPQSWEQSLVRVEVSRKVYDYYQPWNRANNRSMKTGLVVGERRILTTSQELSDRTLVRLQKGGRGKWTTARVEWVDYHANLAMITTDEAAFWSDLQPASLTGAVPAEDAALQILRWREGKLENRAAEFNQFAVRQSEFSALNHVQLEMDSEIQSAGWGEPVIANSHVVGIIAAQRGRACKALPASFIRAILDARQAGRYRGLGYFHFYWQRADNTASLANLKLPGDRKSVV